MTWHHENPGSTSWVETGTTRRFTRQEMDPLGAETGTYDPYQYTSNPDYADVHGNSPLYVARHGFRFEVRGSVNSSRIGRIGDPGAESSIRIPAVVNGLLVNGFIPAPQEMVNRTSKMTEHG